MNIENWIIKKEEPFQGWTQTYLKENGTVAYSDGQTFEDYNKKHEGRMKLITTEELDQLITSHEKSLMGNWAEIKESDYYDQYECLPPIYRGQFWFSMEPTTGSLHQCYIKTKDKFYTSLRNVYTTSSELDKDFRSATPKTLQLDE